MPDKDIACLTNKNFLAQASAFQLTFYVGGRLRHLIVDGMQTTMGKHIGWNFMASRIVGNGTCFVRLIVVLGLLRQANEGKQIH